MKHFFAFLKQFIKSFSKPDMPSMYSCDEYAHLYEEAEVSNG
jgi:hypothetical protein